MFMAMAEKKLDKQDFFYTLDSCRFFFYCSADKSRILSKFGRTPNENGTTINSKSVKKISRSLR